jgi:hypothetical protein
MENTIQLNKINEVDLGDNTLTADLTPRSGVAPSTECTPDEPVVVESRDGDGDWSVFGAEDGVGSVSGVEDGFGSMSGAGAGGEGGFVAFQKKEMQKTSKV